MGKSDNVWYFPVGAIILRSHPGDEWRHLGIWSYMGWVVVLRGWLSPLSCWRPNLNTCQTRDNFHSVWLNSTSSPRPCFRCCDRERQRNGFRHFLLENPMQIKCAGCSSLILLPKGSFAFLSWFVTLAPCLRWSSLESEQSVYIFAFRVKREFWF